MTMLKQEFLSQFHFTLENKTISIPCDILKKILLEVPLNEVMSFSLAIQIDPSLANIDYALFGEKAMYQGSTTNHYPCSGYIYDCGKLSLHERDDKAPYYLLDSLYHLHIFSSSNRKKIVEFKPHKRIVEQCIIARNHQTIAIGHANGDILIQHLPEPQSSNHSQKAKKTFFSKKIVNASSTKKNQELVFSHGYAQKPLQHRLLKKKYRSKPLCLNPSVFVFQHGKPPLPR